MNLAISLILTMSATLAMASPAAAGGGGAAPPPAVVPPTGAAGTQDITKNANDLIAQLKAISKDSDEYKKAVSSLTESLRPLRSKANVDYLYGAADDLVEFIERDIKASQKADATQKIKPLAGAVDKIRDANLQDRVTRLADGLEGALGEPMSVVEADAIVKKLQALDSALVTFAKSRGPRIHIISASYGDHTSSKASRRCNATNYFQSKCERQAKDCPAVAISAGPLCGYDPAPLAEARLKSALVEFQCVVPSTMAARWNPAGAASRVYRVQLRGEQKITCDPR